MKFLKAIYDIRENSRSDRIGYLFALLSAALYGSIPVVAKVLVGDGGTGDSINPFVLMTCVAGVNSIFFTFFVRSKAKINQIRKSVIVSLLGMASVIVIGALLFYFGLRSSTAVNATIIGSAEIIVTVIITGLIYREKLHRKEILPFFIITFGVIVLPIGNDLINGNLSFTELVLGDVLLLIATIFFALDTAFSKYASDRLDSIKIMQIGSVLTTLSGAALILIQGIPFEVAINDVFGIVFIGIFGVGISGVLFMTSLRLIGAIRTILIYATNIIFGVAFAGMFLGEPILLINLISIALGLGGIYLLRDRLVS